MSGRLYVRIQEKRSIKDRELSTSWGSAAYFQQDVLRKLHEEMEVTDWKQHNGHTNTRPPPIDRTGDDDEQPKAPLPAPTLTYSARRIAGKTSPSNSQGEKICWNSHTHAGFPDLQCLMAHEYYKNPDRLSAASRLVLGKKGGFKKRPNVEPGKAGGRIR